MPDIFHRRACEILGTDCDSDASKLITTVGKEISDLGKDLPHFGENLLKLLEKTTVVGLYQELSKNPEQLNKFISDVISTNTTTGILNPHFKDAFSGFSGDIGNLLKLSVTENGETVALIHDAVRIATEAYDATAEKSNYDECCLAVDNSIKGAASYLAGSAAAGGTATGGAAGGAIGIELGTAAATLIMANSKPLAQKACKKVYSPGH